MGEVIAGQIESQTREEPGSSSLVMVGGGAGVFGRNLLLRGDYRHGVDLAGLGVGFSLALG